MSEVFDHYAHYYDLLYRDKDYATETAYVASHIQIIKPNASTILELGCGTGAHAECFARLGFTVVGIDMSPKMLSQAETRKAGLPAEIAARLTFIQGDVRTLRSQERYDAVVSLFHVMSYQTTNSDLEATFATAASHLSNGGVFLCDFWYGPAVLTQKPNTRVKRFENDAVKITRIAEPVTYINENLVDVNYSIFIEEKLTSKITQQHETHRMRYLFLPELLFMTCHSKCWSNFNSFAWLKSVPLSIEDWSGFAIFKRQ